MMVDMSVYVCEGVCECVWREWMFWLARKEERAGEVRVFYSLDSKLQQ